MKYPSGYLSWEGKIDEVRTLWELHATGVICDDELSPAQLRNLEDSGHQVMDRTMVILDILHPGPAPVKIQELAQLKYRAVRLVACATPCPVWAAASAPGTG